MPSVDSTCLSPADTLVEGTLTLQGRLTLLRHEVEPDEVVVDGIGVVVEAGGVVVEEVPPEPPPKPPTRDVELALLLDTGAGIKPAEAGAIPAEGVLLLVFCEAVDDGCGLAAAAAVPLAGRDTEGPTGCGLLIPLDGANIHPSTAIAVARATGTTRSKLLSASLEPS